MVLGVRVFEGIPGMGRGLGGWVPDTKPLHGGGKLCMGWFGVSSEIDSKSLSDTWEKTADRC